nr:MFS transporter [Cysteiniphilum sp. 19X3-34]
MLAAFIIFIGMDLIDTTIINNILPKIAKSFDIEPVYLKFGISVYILVLGVFLLMSAWLAQKIGFKRTLILSGTGFALFSFLCGIAQTDIQFFIFRGFQGLFAAFSAPVASLAYLEYSSNNQHAAISLSSYSVLLAILGQVLGGVFAYISADSWRLAFYINVPLSMLAIAIVCIYFPKEAGIKSNNPFDYKGFILIGITVTALFAFSEVATFRAVPISLKILIACIAIVSCLLYIYLYKKIETPLINFNVFNNRPFLTVFLIIFISRLTTYWVFFAWPVILYYLSTLNMIYIATMSVYLMIGSVIGNMITKRISTTPNLKKTVTLSLMLMAIMLAVSPVFILHFSYPYFCGMAFCYGFALGLFQGSSNAALFATNDSDKRAHINTLKLSAGLISNSFSLVLFTVLYNIIRTVSIDLHWLAFFVDIVVKISIITAAIQLMLAAVMWYTHRKSLSSR